MKSIIILVVAMTKQSNFAQQNPTLVSTIISLEKAALERWNKGDVNGFLELSDKDVVYFDPYLDKRVNGLSELTGLYKPLQGQIKVDNYEMVDPLVHSIDNMAVLTFNLRSYTGVEVTNWNCTEVFRKDGEGKWKIIHTHWSLTKPELKN
jgi:ketosteroid isomerase-like protein